MLILAIESYNISPLRCHFTMLTFEKHFLKADRRLPASFTKMLSLIVGSYNYYLLEFQNSFLQIIPRKLDNLDMSYFAQSLTLMTTYLTLELSK